MIPTPFTIDFLLHKHLQDKPLTTEEGGIFEEWLSRSGDHRALPLMFRDKQWVRQGLRELDATPIRQTWHNIFANMDDSWKRPAAVLHPVTRIWKWESVAAAVLTCIIFSWISTHIHYPSTDNSSNETYMASMSGGDGTHHQQTTAGVMYFIGGDSLILDALRDGVIDGDAAFFGVIKKHRDTISYSYSEDIAMGRLMNKVSTDSGKGLTLLLPDGSKVSLKGMSRIGALPSTDSNTRVLSLTGEAFFEVPPHSGLAFIVHAGGMRVSVLGTAFSIKAYPDAKSHTVKVVRGSVRVDSGGRSVTLDTVNNNVAEVSGSGIDARREYDGDSLQALRSRRQPLKIKNDELETAVKKVAGLYGMKVDNSQHIHGVSVHGTFYPEKRVLDNLEDIKKVVGKKIVSFDIKGDTILILRGKP